MTDAELPRLTRVVLDLAFLELEQRERRLLPFAMTESGGARTMHRFTPERVDRMEDRARRFLRTDSADLAALVWTGSLIDDETPSDGAGPTDAVFVEAADRTDGGSFVVAQPYGWGGLLRRRPRPSGHPVFVGRGRLFA